MIASIVKIIPSLSIVHLKYVQLSSRGKAPADGEFWLSLPLL